MLKKTRFRFKAVLFDLDGTLIDTAPDLAAALNYVLISENKPPLALEDIRPFASEGVRGLLALGFNIHPGHEKYAGFQKRLTAHYSRHIAQHARLFKGIDSLLKHLAANNISWGIVTNKPCCLTKKLLTHIKLTVPSGCVVCGDTLDKRKPDPAPLHYAAKLLSLSSQECCYIGDAERDMIAAKAADMFSIGALYGYIPKNAQPHYWQADAYVYAPAQLLEIFRDYSSNFF